jgi:hypothetical protein
MTHFAELASSGALIWCRKSSHLELQVRELLELRSSPERKARRQLVATLVTTQPGTYAARLGRYCREIVEPRGRKMRAERTARARSTISHAYGANLIAGDYCGTSELGPVVPGYWMHGWMPAYHNVDPALIALHKKHGQSEGYDYESQIAREKNHTPQWVSRADQQQYLISHGYQHVEVVGLPAVYLPQLDVRRVPGSLLVMPPHSHKCHGPGTPLAESYADAIADVRKDFEHVWVCLNEDDLRAQQWVESFRRRGIGVFLGTDQSDPRTLLRLKRILRSFEYVTTNGFGSHIAYAAYWGARVSVFGPFAEFPRARMARTHAVKMFPRLLDAAYWLCTEEALRQHYPFLFTEPKQATDRTKWGAFEVGEQHRRSPHELAALFAWPMVHPLEPEARRSSAVTVGSQAVAEA